MLILVSRNIMDNGVALFSLTHSLLIGPPKSFVWIYATFDNNFGTKNGFTKCLGGKLLVMFGIMFLLQK